MGRHVVLDEMHLNGKGCEQFTDMDIFTILCECDVPYGIGNKLYYGNPSRLTVSGVSVGLRVGDTASAAAAD